MAVILAMSLSTAVYQRVMYERPPNSREPQLRWNRGVSSKKVLGETLCVFETSFINDTVFASSRRTLEYDQMTVKKRRTKRRREEENEQKKRSEEGNRYSALTITIGVIG